MELFIFILFTIILSPLALSVEKSTSIYSELRHLRSYRLVKELKEIKYELEERRNYCMS